MMAVLLSQAAQALDGIALSYHSAYTDPAGLHSGAVVRHIIRADTVAESSTIYAAADARGVCLSPEGYRVAFVRATDGALCVMGIGGGAIDSLKTVSPCANIDWADSSWIYFTPLYNHVTLARIHAVTGEEETVGWFPVGAIRIAVSSRPPSDTRGIALLDFGAGRYQASTFDYRVFLINTHNACGAAISPSGGYYAIGPCELDAAVYHKNMAVYSWDGAAAGTISSPQSEFINRVSWSVNSDEWLVASAGKDRELLVYHDMVIIARDGSKMIRVTDNSAGAYDEGCDFWAGDPDEALEKSAANPIAVARQATQHVRHTADARRRSAAIHLFTPDGRRAPPASALPAGLYICVSGGASSVLHTVLVR